MPRLIVSPLSAVRAVVRSHGPSHVISLLDPSSMIDTPHPIPGERHLRLGLHDIPFEAPDLVAPGEADVRRIVAFVDGWDREDPMLVHCWAGVSRSTATAFIALCRLNPSVDESDIAAEMRLRASHIQPNRRLVRFADALLGRGGRMERAVERLGPAEPVYEGTVWDIPADFALAQAQD